MLTGGGIGAPVTGSKSPQMFFYQFSIADDSVFTTNEVILEAGSSRSYTYSVAKTVYARARARFVNGPFSQWKPYGPAITYTPPVTPTPVYRPFEYTASQPSPNGILSTNPYLGMDGDTTTSNNLTFSSAPANIIYGPFLAATVLTSGLSLYVVTQNFEHEWHRDVHY